MKNSKFLVLLLSFIMAVGCSKDDDGFEEIEVVETPKEPVETAFYPDAEDARLYMVDPDATVETVALFYHLKNLSKTNFVVGQQDAFSSFYGGSTGESDMKKLTGNDPGLLGSDFMFITDDANNGPAANWFFQQEQMIIEHAIEAYNKGMINTFSWHLREPYEGL